MAVMSLIKDTNLGQKKAGKKKRGRVLSLSKCDLFFFLSAVTLSDQIPSPAHATDHHTIDFDLACLKSTMQLNLWMSINSGLSYDDFKLKLEDVSSLLKEIIVLKKGV
ncbi:hypothetical protein P8452_67264 [Trifolium repens]|nr:hypothetical protein P8452_67264 [Trifolium repens]